MRVSKVSLALLIALLSFASTLAAPHRAPSAEITCPAGSCKLYLSLIAVPGTPQLLAPADAFASPSLAPTLSWSPVVLGVHNIQVSSDPLFIPGTNMPVDVTKTV